MSWVEVLLLTAALVCIATAVRLGFGFIFSTSLVFATYFPAVILVGLFIGAQAALATIALSVVATWWAVLPPMFIFNALDRSAIVNIAIFVVINLFIIWFTTLYRNLLFEFGDQQDQLRLMLRETQHRGRNLLTVLTMIIRESVSNPVERDRLIKRMNALAVTQDLIDERGGNADLEQLLTSELTDVFGTVVRLDGPALNLTAVAAKSLRLIFHELATNAVKYGSLSVPTGRLSVTWTVTNDVVDIEWKETDGPKVSAPSKHHFGSKLVIRMVQALGAQLVPVFLPSGYTYRIVADRNKLCVSI